MTGNMRQPVTAVGAANRRWRNVIAVGGSLAVMAVALMSPGSTFQATAAATDAAQTADTQVTDSQPASDSTATASAEPNPAPAAESTAQNPAATPASDTPPAAGAAKLEFNRDIRPIMVETCFACHGADSASRKADLRLDKRDAAIERSAIVPGNPDESEMVRRLFSEDPKEVMPPANSHKVLTAEQKEVLKRWVAEGAEYQPHWSFLPPQRAALPTVSNPAWVRQPIDAFVLAGLDSLGLTPAPEADKTTLARRAAFDVTGLPPDPQMLATFLNDSSPDAYEKYLDVLFALPQWGEHRGRHWLDYARYADTHGIHFDNYREVWAYRDWVISAFNSNMPFDQFTIEQLAGDLLPDRSLDHQIASGFNRCNMTTNEGGVIPEEYVVLYARDRSETTAAVWMGLTVGCAVCHDHKFDPISQKEFYSFSAFFNNTTQNPMDGNIKDTPPIVTVPRTEDRRRWDELLAEVPQATEARNNRATAARVEFDAWINEPRQDAIAALIPVAGLQFLAPLNEGTGNAVKVDVDGVPRELSLATGLSWEPGYVAASSYRTPSAGNLEIDSAGDYERDMPFSFAAWVRPSKLDQNGSIVARMNEAEGHRGWDIWFENGRIGIHLVHRWPDDALKVIGRQPLAVNEWSHIAVTYDGSSQPQGLRVYVNGVQQETDTQATTLKNTTRTTVPLKIGTRHMSSRLTDLGLQDIRLYGRLLAAEEVKAIKMATRGAWLLAKPAEQRTDAEKNELFTWWLPERDEPYRELQARLSELEREQSDIKSRGTIASVMQEKSEAAMAFLLFRGQYDQRRDAVTPEVPAALPPFPATTARNRLGLAQWLLLPSHPLTSRVTVNRFWQEIFGTGIVRTTGDLGIAGELPSNQALLDWMAVEFRENNWDVKKFFRMVLTSATYRQSALATKQKLELDPQNRFFSRGPRFRMDAEMIRDAALAASGLLVRKLGGPSVKPYQPDGVWEAVAMDVSNTRNYTRDTGENLYRRSMYTFWKRAAPPASMDVLNAPSREVCTVRRDRTNTPLQALVTLNDPQFVEAARHLAETTLKHGGDTIQDRMRFITQRLIARELRPDELSVVTNSLAEMQTFYSGHPQEAASLISVGESRADGNINPQELAAWTMLVNELMNLDEVVCK